MRVASAHHEKLEVDCLRYVMPTGL
jgi:hypothetical protein